MTEQTEQTEQPTQDLEVTEATEQPTADVTDEAQQEKATEKDGAGREAAKYRRRLRETEGERDALATRLEAMQRLEAERIAAVEGVVAKALWSTDVELAALLNDDGTVNAAKVQEAAIEARESLGIRRPLPGNYVPTEGKTPSTYRGSTFEDAFRL